MNRISKILKPFWQRSVRTLTGAWEVLTRLVKRTKNNLWNIVLVTVIPLGELKALFYHSDRKVDWYLLSDNKRWIDNVLEDYGNALTFIVLFGYILWCRRTPFGMAVIRFLFIVSVLDLLHLGAFDKQGLILLKFALATGIWILWYKQKAILSWLQRLQIF